MNVKYQSVKITLPNATAASNLDKKVTLTSEMPHVTGIAVYGHPTKDGGAAVGKKLGLKMGATVIQDLTTIDDFLVGSNVPPNERYKMYDFPADGRELTINYEIDAALTADWEIMVVLRCEKQV